MENLVTNSIIVQNEEDFKSFSEVLATYENEKGLQDIALLEEYSNILMDCAEENADDLMRIMRENHKSLYWRWMVSEGERIKRIATYDENGFHSENIDKSMDEIAAESTYTCSGSCSDCSGECNREHDDKCSCGHCSHNDFSLAETVEMTNDLAYNGEGETFFPTLVNAFFEGLKEFVTQQTENADDADDAYDLFLHMLTQIVLAAAACDGSYALREHDCIEQITGELDFDRTKSALSSLTPDEESMTRAMSYWYTAQDYGCDVRKYVLMMCAYVCSADAPVNDKELEFLKMLEQARGL